LECKKPKRQLAVEKAQELEEKIKKAQQRLKKRKQWNEPTRLERGF